MCPYDVVMIDVGRKHILHVFRAGPPLQSTELPVFPESANLINAPILLVT